MAKRNGWITIKGIIITAIIIVLALGVWGGLKIAEERGEQSRRAEAVREAEDRLDEIAARETETPDSEGGSEQAAEQQSPGREDDSDTAATVGYLPETGPGDFVSVVALAGLAFVVSSFIASRRQVKLLAANHL